MAIDKNNTNWGAAAFGGEVGITDNTTNTVDSYDPDQSDDDLLDVDVANSGNDSSTQSNNNGNDSSTDLSAADFLNDKSTNTNTDNSDNSNDDVNNIDDSVDLSASDFLNNKSINTDNSDNSDDDILTFTDNSTDVDQDYDESFNTSDDDLNLSFTDSSATDSYNDNSTDDDTTVMDSGNFTLGVSIADSFGDNDLVDIDSLTGPIEGLQVLGGSGNIFDLDQVMTLNDGDVLSDPNVTNDACFDQYSDTVNGGTANASSGFGDANGDADVGSNASASAGGAANLSAFNQDIAMGANIQYASVDMTVIGGSDGASLMGDDS